MKKIIFLLIVAVCTLYNVTAAPVSVQTAEQVGQNFLSQIKRSTISNVNLVYYTESYPDFSDSQVVHAFYVFSAFPDGFVIVAGDDRCRPILGYSENGYFDPDNMPENLKNWLQGYEREILYAIEHGFTAGAETQAQWTALVNGQEMPAENRSLRAVSPLISTTWDQSAPYNNLCPSGSAVGCVATAMAQVMKFWEWPTTGTGSYSYEEDDYGTLSADFGSTTYNWSNMPNNLTNWSNSTQKTAVATLMFHCGVSVAMDYSPEGSGAYMYYYNSQPSAYKALKTYFGYKNSIAYRARTNYTEANWINLLKAELDAGRPIIYSGNDENYSGGHCFVCDGYNTSDEFHFNWGWSGYYDGYFAISSLNPGGGGIGGGSYDFSYNQSCLVGIEPDNGGGGGGGGDDENANEVDYQAYGYIAGPNSQNYITSLSLSATDGLNPYLVVYNNGPSVVSASDSIYFDIYINNQFYDNLYGLGSDFSALSAGNGTAIYSDSPIMTAAEMNDAGLYGSFEFCYTIRIVSSTGTVDPDLGNNTACLTITRPNAPTYTISVNSSNNNYGTVSGGGTYTAGTQVTLRATPHNGYQFIRWNDGNTNATRTITVTGNASYTAYFAISTSIDDTNLETISVYPNPTTGKFFVQGAGIQQIDIYDMNGKKIMTKDESSLLNPEINLTNSSSGIYMVRVLTKEGVTNCKVMKE